MLLYTVENLKRGRKNARFGQSNKKTMNFIFGYVLNFINDAG